MNEKIQKSRGGAVSSAKHSTQSYIFSVPATLNSPGIQISPGRASREGTLFFGNKSLWFVRKPLYLYFLESTILPSDLVGFCVYFFRIVFAFAVMVVLIISTNSMGVIAVLALSAVVLLFSRYTLVFLPLAKRIKQGPIWTHGDICHINTSSQKIIFRNTYETCTIGDRRDMKKVLSFLDKKGVSRILASNSYFWLDSWLFGGIPYKYNERCPHCSNVFTYYTLIKSDQKTMEIACPGCHDVYRTRPTKNK